MNAVAQYVMTHAQRGDCTCGKCLDAVANPQQPNGHTADLVFFKVAAVNNADANTMRDLVQSEYPHWLDGKEHSYLEMGANIGDQGLALTAMGLGSLLGIWKLTTPRILPISEDLQQQMAGAGYITIQRR